MKQSKKISRAVVLGLLMSAPCSVWAEHIKTDTTLNRDTTYSGGLNIAKEATLKGSRSENITISGTTDAPHAVYVYGELKDLGTITAVDGRFTVQKGGVIDNVQSIVTTKQNDANIVNNGIVNVGSLNSATNIVNANGGKMTVGTLTAKQAIHNYGGEITVTGDKISALEFATGQNGQENTVNFTNENITVEIQKDKKFNANNSTINAENTNVHITGGLILQNGSEGTFNSLEVGGQISNRDTSSISVKGSATAKDFGNSGTFSADSLTVTGGNISNSGTLNITNDINVKGNIWNTKVLTAKNIIAGGEVKNDGTMTLFQGDVTAKKFVNNGNATVSGKFTLEAGDGKFSNKGTMYVTSGTIVSENTRFDHSGQLYNGTVDNHTDKLDEIRVSKIINSSTLNVETLNVVGDNGKGFYNAVYCNGANAVLNAENIITKHGDQYGKLMVLVANGGTVNAQNITTNVLKNSDNGSKGTINIADGGKVIADIGIDNRKNGVITVGKNTEIKSSWLDNYGSAKFTVGENSKVLLEDALWNFGEFTAKTDSVIDVGELKNTGSFVADKLIVSSGNNGYTGSLNISDMTINGGGSFNFENTTHTAEIGSLRSSDATINLAQGSKLHIGTTENDSKLNFTVKETGTEQIILDKNESDNLTITGDKKITDSFGENIQEGMQSLADSLNIKDGVKNKNVVAEAGKIYGEITGKTDGNGNVVVTDAFVNQYNQGISEMASISLMTWRQENNDMNKRLGELRNSNGEHGIWSRMTRGESKYGNQGIKNQYNSYQIGYDEKLSTNKAWTVGAALTYTDGTSSFDKGTGENTHKGMAVYGSYLGEDGSFVDIIAKYARLEHEFDVAGGAGKGEYDTNGYSISAEYGKRFEQGNGFWIEPQVELTYGKVSSASYVTNEDVHVNQDGMKSFVGRVGFSLGKDIKQGNVYVRASYLYDFDGETNVNYSYKGVKSSFEQDLGGGWFEVGVGTNYNLSDATYLYFDVEKTYGGDVATPWQWNAGVRYSF